MTRDCENSIQTHMIKIIQNTKRKRTKNRNRTNIEKKQQTILKVLI